MLVDIIKKQNPLTILIFAIIFSFLAFFDNKDFLENFFVLKEHTPEIKEISKVTINFRQIFYDIGILFGILGGLAGIVSCIIQIVQILYKKELK